ncbi:DUF975 family protein [Vagococcus fessus]|nr:DUF975 family protein [Vagococcus fessus]
MFKTSATLKRDAKQMLKGRWKDAILLNLVPSLLKVLSVWLITIVIAGGVFLALVLGSVITDEGTVSPKTEQFGGDVYDNGDLDGDDFDKLLEESDDDIVSPSSNSGSGIWSALIGVLISFMTIGISFTFIEVYRNPNRKISPMADQFRMFNGKDFVPLFLVQLFTTIFTYLWSLLFLVPGIIKSYAYSQSFYIYKDLSEHTETASVGATSYITESRALMNGHKGRLFYIDLSFIGWHMVCWLTLGLGYFVLFPYINATKAAFYRDLSKDRYTASANNATTDETEWTSF